MAKKKSKKKNKKSKSSSLERKFWSEWKLEHPHHMPRKEFKFSPTRLYRLDFAWPEKRLAVEIHGMGVGHYSLPGMTGDFDKHMHTIVHNWTVIYLTGNHLKDDRRDTVFEFIASRLGIHKQSSQYISLKERLKQADG